jgi:outer membrane protein
MQVSQTERYSIGSKTLALVLAGLMMAPTSVFAQEAQPMPEKPQPRVNGANGDFTKPKGHFPNPIGPYTARKVLDPVFSNTPRLEQLVKNGQLVLSLNDTIALALENNLDLAIARYNLDIAETDILRARAGGTIRGVATGLVQGTPGGGQGGFGTGASGAGAGGTASGAGGAGAGAAGIVSSTFGVGAPVEQFDPSLTGTLQLERAKVPVSNPVTLGVPFFQQNSTTANFAYNQGFLTGTAMSVGFNNNRETNNSPNSFTNPTLNSNFSLNVRQRLLQGFGINNQTRFIRIAKNNLLISDEAFRNQVISTVSQIQNIYWDLVNAYEDVKVRERSLGLAEKTLSDNKKQVEIGTLAPIEIVRAESEVATRNQELIVARTNLQLQQTLIKNAVSRSLNDPTLAALPVVPTDVMLLGAVQDDTRAAEDMIKEALANRPDIRQSRIDLTNRDISKRAARNALLPFVDIFGFYGASALGGNQNPLITCATATCTPAEIAERRIPPGTIPSRSYGGTFANLFDSSAPDKGAGINITIPLRNRSAQADQARSELEYRQAQLRLQQQENTINIEVRNAAFALAQNRARVDAAIKGRELARQSLDAEQKRYSLGASTNFQVLQAQRDLAQAESTLVSATSAYEKSRVELDRVTGRTLERNNISVSDARVGTVTQMPSVQGVGPAPAQQR